MTELSDASHFSSIPNYNISYKKTRKMIPCIFGVKTELADPKLAPIIGRTKTGSNKTGPNPKLAYAKTGSAKTGPIQKLAHR